MDFASYFVDAAALAGVIIVAVSFIKTHILTSLHDLATVGVSLAAGAVLGVAGHFLGYVDGGIPAAAAFGISAGLLASGGWDAITGMLAKRS